jgi:allophanate hydrolase
VFAVSAHDAGAVLDAAAWFDLHDPLAREASSAELRSFGPKPRFGVPPSDDLDFFGDREAESLFAAATATLEQVGGTRCKSAFAPFRNAGRLLYNGPWLAERLHATQALLDDDPDAILPVTRSIIERGRHYSALDAYRAQYELAQLKREADVAFKSIDGCFCRPPARSTRQLRLQRTRSASMPISVFIRIS